MTAIAEAPWRRAARERATEHFRVAWEGAPPGGREALLDAAARGGVGHRWEQGRRACVLALLVRPALRPGETSKMAAYRWFGCDVTDEFPATWDGEGVALAQLLGSVGISMPQRRRSLARLLPLRPRPSMSS